MARSHPSLSLLVDSRELKHCDMGSLSPESEDGSDAGPSPQTQGGSGVDVPASPEDRDDVDKDTGDSSESRHSYGIDDSSSDSGFSQHSYGINDSSSESDHSQHSYGINDDGSKSDHSQHSYGINDDGSSINAPPSPTAWEEPPLQGGMVGVEALHLQRAQGADASVRPSCNPSAAQDGGNSTIH
jgi:hypothetical protein